MEVARAWMQLDLLLKKKEQKHETSTSEWVCPCGGIKVMGYMDGDEYGEHTLPTCTTCGRCDSEYISDEPEWRGGVGEDGDVSDPSRCGAPTDDRFSEMWSMGTKMVVSNYASYNQKKLAMIDFHNSMNYKDRSLFHNYQDLEKAGKDLPKHVVREAEHMYRKFTGEKLTRGGVRMGIKANCLLQACKDNNISRSVDEIAGMFGIVPKDVTRTSEMFRDVIKPKKTSILMASDLAARMLNNFTEGAIDYRRIRMTVIKKCEIIQEDPELLGKTPKTIAATVILVILMMHGLEKDFICEKCEVSYPTLKKIEQIVRSRMNV
jgi:transcription initiation factor TFIIIB Brf1 subunit/transcription initiation factor TFIIB